MNAVPTRHSLASYRDWGPSSLKSPPNAQKHQMLYLGHLVALSRPPCGRKPAQRRRAVTRPQIYFKPPSSIMTEASGAATAQTVTLLGGGLAGFLQYLKDVIPRWLPCFQQGSEAPRRFGAGVLGAHGIQPCW